MLSLSPLADNNRFEEQAGSAAMKTSPPSELPRGSAKAPPEAEISLRVQYFETDRMGVVHHSNYLRYFETARMEQFRNWGYPYDQLEQAGCRLMITDLECKCRKPARFDEVLRVRTWIEKMTTYRIVHRYRIESERHQLVALGKTVLASVNKEGYPVPLSEFLPIE